MRPDPDLMRMAASQAERALKSVGRFLSRTGSEFGYDGSYTGSRRSIGDLAVELRRAADSLDEAVRDADERQKAGCWKPVEDQT